MEIFGDLSSGTTARADKSDHVKPSLLDFKLSVPQMDSPKYLIIKLFKLVSTENGFNRIYPMFLEPHESPIKNDQELPPKLVKMSFLL